MIESLLLRCQVKKSGRLHRAWNLRAEGKGKRIHLGDDRIVTGQSRSISRVLFRWRLLAAMIIPLGHTLPHASSDRTRRHRASHPSPTFSHMGNHGTAFLFGLAPGGVYQAPDVTIGTGALLPHRFTLTGGLCGAACRSPQDPGGLLSVALSLGLPPLDVIQHPALWSPDFPPSARGRRAIT
jgi:hypothetical protein